jgi:protein O-GlcNAc transferase
MDTMDLREQTTASNGRNVPAPACVVTWLQSALAHHREGRVQDAAALYEQILAVDPQHADATHFIGLLLCDTGDVATGIRWIEQSIALNPDAIYYSNLGNVLMREGEHAAAIIAYREAVALRSDYADAHNNLGNALRMARDSVGAMESCATALALRPDYVEAWSNLGDALTQHGSFDAAIKSYTKALALRPDYAEAHNNLGNLFEKQGRLADAATCYRQAVALKPGVAAIRNNLGNVLRDQGLLAEAVDAYRSALAIDTTFQPHVHSNLLLQLNMLAQVSPQELLAESCRFGELQATRAQPFAHGYAAWDDSERPLRVGFVSGDLNAHPVGYFLEGMIAALDKSRFEPVAYATRSHEDSLTARLKPHFNAWHLLEGRDDETCAKQIRADGIDILIDLSGHTNHNRLPLFAWKPAPVQVSWMGYFATTGVRAIDYILGDDYVLPNNEASHFVERMWRLPECYVCFTPPTQDIAIGPLPMLQNGAPTFGCFNHLVKLNDAVIALWARVLHAVPGSRLFLKTKQLNDASTRAALAARFAARGIDETRLILEGESPRAELLAAYNRVDIALDPFPYPGGTTTIEALWMGVPVLTRRGDRFLSHVGESVLHNAGLPQWIAGNDDEYVGKAVEFAAARDDLAHHRTTLRQQLLDSPLCDATRFARHLEAAFEGMWREAANIARHRAGEAAEAAASAEHIAS